MYAAGCKKVLHLRDLCVTRTDGMYNPSSFLWVCLRVSSQLDKPRVTPQGDIQEAFVSNV